MDFKVTHVGVYRHAQWLQEVRPYTCLGFLVDGVERLFEDGVDLGGHVPLLLLGRRGGLSEFVSNARRENWVVMLEGLSFHPTASPGSLELRCGAVSFQLPVATPVPRELAPGWQSEFELMREAWCEPTPRNLFRLESMVMNIFRHLAESMAPAVEASPAARLKRLIDADLDFASGLEELSRRCGYCGDHLRKLFEREFNMSPNQYRARRKLARALELVSDSSLEAKELAERLGFAQLPAFSSWFKKMSGMTPGEAIARQRSRRAANIPGSSVCPKH